MRYLAIATMVLLGGCLSSTGPSRDDLEAARAAWNAVGPLSYSYLINFDCVCPDAQYKGTVRVTVENKVVVDRIVESTAQPAAGYESRYPAVEGLFDVIQDAVNKRANSSTVTYNSQFGYPVFIQLNIRSDDPNDQYLYQISEFVAN